LTRYVRADIVPVDPPIESVILQATVESLRDERNRLRDRVVVLEAQIEVLRIRALVAEDRCSDYERGRLAKKIFGL